MKRALAAAALATLLVACGERQHPRGGPVAGWPAWGGDAGGTRYSPLAEIHRGNVADLEVAWTFRRGDFDPSDELKTSYPATLLYEGALYLCTPFDRVFAIDAETGAERWVLIPASISRR